MIPLRRFSTLLGLGSIALVGTLLAGCGGGAGTSTVPSTQQIVKSAPHAAGVIRHMNLSRATIPAVMAKLQHAAAYASPIRGGHIVQLHGLKPQTVSAGNNLVNNGGPVVQGASVYNILVNCADESCWGGGIGQFENDFFNSNMVGILDQYTGITDAGALVDGGDYSVTYDTSAQLGDQDIDNIVYQVATQNNISTGYKSIFNVFLASGVQQCSTAAGGCYAQQYCAYHGSNDYTDIGHALYTVEPYQDIQGCQVSNLPSPNGSTQDSTASTLSHELSELITDPDVAANNTAWYNQTGGEIGDLCAPATGVPTANVQLVNDTWEIQSEYDNNVSDCSYTP